MSAHKGLLALAALAGMSDYPDPLAYRLPPPPRTYTNQERKEINARKAKRKAQRAARKKGRA